VIVVADTSPINYLVLLDRIEILSVLYRHVLIPEEVYRELLDDGTPPAVRAWAKAHPGWLQIMKVTDTINPALNDLDTGEREAILLALQEGVRFLLMDDGAGRAHARHLELEVTGTLGILEKAAQQGLLDFREALASLAKTNFRASDAVLKDFLTRNP
jgi:predicted nucleic acid-binding protein